MPSVVARRRARGARVAIALLACPAVARAQERPVPDVPDRLDPDSPLAAMPGLGVDWPDLSRPDAAPAAAAAEPKSSPVPTGDQRYAVRLLGLDEVADDGLRARFDALSALHADESKPANVAQVDRRARDDAELLRSLLRARGYYDAEVDTAVGTAEGPGAPRLLVTLTAQPGGLYTFSTVATPGLERTGADRAALAQALAIKPGDPVDADRVTAGVTALRTGLATRGYPFASVPDPAITVDHDTRQATLTLPVDPGRVARVGAFRVTGSRHVFGPRHVELLSRLKSGDRYDAAQLDDLRRALIQTGLVAVVQVTPVRTADPAMVDLEVRLEPAPPRTVSATFGYTSGARLTPGTLGYSTLITTGTLGYGTGQGATAEVDWTHRNLFPPEGSLTLRGVLGTQEQLASAIVRRNNFRRRDQVLSVQLTADRVNFPAYRARTLDLLGSVERQTNIIWQKKWTYSYGAEIFGSDERDELENTGVSRRRTYVVAALPLSLGYDGTDNLLNPTRGYRLSARISPEYSFHNASFAYARLQLDGSAYQPVGSRLVLAGRVRLGSIQGGTRDDIAPTRRFYSGGGGSVRGYGYQRIGPRDAANDPIGGKSLAEFGLEARIRFGNFGVVPFLDGGNLYTQALPRFTGLRYGTGLGARYYTSFGPIRVDVGTPINRQPGDSRAAVYVSLGQAF